MMEQMLKLCMFLMRAKLTIAEAAGRSGGGGGRWGGAVFGGELWVDIFGLFTYCSEGAVQNKRNKIQKKKQRRRVRVCVMSQS